MSLRQQHRSVINPANVLDITFDNYDGNTEIILANNGGYFNTVVLDNVDTVSYEINDTKVIPPFFLNDGDSLRIDINRTTSNLTSRIIISDNEESLSDPSLLFSFQGEVYNDATANYDTEILLYECKAASENTYNRILQQKNILSYILEIDTGSGFSVADLPFTTNTGDIIRLTINKETAANEAYIQFANSVHVFTLNINKSVYGFTPYCTQKFNGTSQYCTIANDVTMRMGSGLEECIGGWIYPTTNANEVVIDATQTTNSKGWYLSLAAGVSSPKLQFELWDDAGNSIGVNTTEIPLNKWTFYNINKSTGDVISVKLGDKDTKALTTATLTDVSVGTLTGLTGHTNGSEIGRRKDNTLHFSGHIDNMHKINRVMTDKEIEVFFNNGWGGYPASVLKTEIDYFFKISRLANTTYEDFGDAGNDATLVNFTGNLDRYYKETMIAI